MYGVVLLAALNLGTASPGWGNEWCFRSTPHNWYKGGFLPPGGYEGWWYSATAWNGCPPVCVPYIKPGCPIPCCCGGCGGPGGPAPFEGEGFGGPPLPAGPEATSPEPKSPEPKSPESKGPESTSSMRRPREQTGIRARVVVELPADARLYVDEQLVATTAGRQVLRTPPLQPGQTYFYDMRLEVVRDGKTSTETRQLTLRPGDEVAASFTEPGPVLAASGNATSQP